MRAQRTRPDADADDALVARARQLYDERRRRAAAFGCDAAIFGEPGWDLLLHLFIAYRRRRPVTLGEARTAAAAPDTTALRWIMRLEEEELVVRTPDPTRSGRQRVALTGKAADAMAELLALGL